MYLKRSISFIFFVLAITSAQSQSHVSAQAPTITATSPATLNRFLDQTNGMTADEAVRIALAGNGELAAMRAERDAVRSMVTQARLRANPR